MADSSLCECARCDDKGEVPATPGQPWDGPMPCPDCQSDERELGNTYDPLDGGW